MQIFSRLLHLYPILVNVLWSLSIFNNCNSFISLAFSKNSFDNDALNISSKLSIIYKHTNVLIMNPNEDSWGMFKRRTKNVAMLAIVYMEHNKMLMNLPL